MYCCGGGVMAFPGNFKYKTKEMSIPVRGVIIRLMKQNEAIRETAQFLKRSNKLTSSGPMKALKDHRELKCVITELFPW